MKKKLLTIIVLIGALSFNANAQITTGNPSAKEIRTGNRPQAGDFGIYTGLSASHFYYLFTSMSNPIPVVNVKYFVTDNLEARCGLNASLDKAWVSGKEKSVTKKSASNESYSYAYIEPGVAYHFSKHNIIDVYAGAEIPLGYDAIKELEINGAADTKSIQAKTEFSVGLRPFIGLQAFIANLPLAIGVEYGYSFNANFGEKYKYTSVSGGTKQVYYAPKGNTSWQWDKLSAGSAALNNEFRITLSYYFK